MSRVTRNLQLLWRSERVLAEARFKLISRKMVMAVMAGIAGLFALGMFNMAGYFALEQSVGSPAAALIVGIVDVLVAGLLLAVAQGLQPGPEEDMVREVRDMAINEIGADVEDVQQKLVQLRDDVEAVRSNITGFVQRPLDAISPAVIIQALSAISKLVKSGKK
jgi:outer membrane murein-binding lipoprotein Lpp